jgi:hypothetical protein
MVRARTVVMPYLCEARKLEAELKRITAIMAMSDNELADIQARARAMAKNMPTGRLPWEDR